MTTWTKNKGSGVQLVKALDDCRRFEVLFNLYADLAAIGEEQLFSYAFSLGLLLALDVVKESQTLYNS